MGNHLDPLFPEIGFRRWTEDSAGEETWRFPDFSSARAFLYQSTDSPERRRALRELLAESDLSGRMNLRTEQEVLDRLARGLVDREFHITSREETIAAPSSSERKEMEPPAAQAVPERADTGWIKFQVVEMKAKPPQ